MGKFIINAMLIVCFVFALIGLILCAILNFSSYWKWEPSYLVDMFPEWSGFALFGGIFVVIIPLIIIDKMEPDSESSLSYAHAPVWMKTLFGACFVYAMLSLVVRCSFLHDYVEERDGLYVLTSGGKVVRELTEEEYHKYSGYEARAFTGIWMLFYVFEMLLAFGTLRARRVVDDDRAREVFMKALQDEDVVVNEQAALSLDNMNDNRAISALLKLLQHNNEIVQKRAMLTLRKVCSSIHTIIFGQYPFKGSDQHHTLYNPDVYQLTVSMPHLKKIIIETATYDFYQVERFLTYAVNYIGQKYLKKHVEVYIYGDGKTLPPNLQNSFTNFCKQVHLYESV